GLPIPREMHGESLLGLVRHHARRRDWSFGLSQNLESWFLVHDGYKLISPPALVPMEAAKRHLAPTNPTGYAESDQDKYTWGQGEDAVPLRYDTERDPLGLRDVLPNTPQLYDRAKDPLELNNLYQQDPERLRAMNAFAAQIMQRAEEEHAELDDGMAQGPV